MKSVTNLAEAMKFYEKILLHHILIEASYFLLYQA